jgi:hypothetical protein
MPSKFAIALAEKLKEKNLKPIDVEKLSKGKVTRQNLSRIFNDTPHKITGAPPRVTRPTVEKIAQAIGWNLDEALDAAGFTSENILKQLPPFLYQINWQDFAPEETFAIESFIGFLLYQRNRSQVLVTEGVKELFSHLDDNKLNNFKKTG